MTRIWMRALFYLMIVGGGWLVVLPAGLLHLERGTIYPDWNGQWYVLAGGVCFAVGLSLAMLSGFYLIQFGHGTPMPLDPPRRLVTCGPYRWVRNPQGIAMVLMVIGEVLAVRSALLWLLLPATVVYLELLVGPYEERQLTRDFGTVYTEYADRVRKWFPRSTIYRNAEPMDEREISSPSASNGESRPRSP